MDQGELGCFSSASCPSFKRLLYFGLRSAATSHHLAFPHNFWIEEKATGATPQICLLHFVEAFLGARLSYTSRGTEPAEAKRVSSSWLRGGETQAPGAQVRLSPGCCGMIQDAATGVWLQFRILVRKRHG